MTAFARAHADVIVAGPGRDRIDGRGGNDRVYVRRLGIEFVLDVAPASREPRAARRR